MEIVKKNIYYIPNICDDAINFNYTKGNIKPMCVYLTDEGLKRIVPNVETYINGKPWYEIGQVSCKVSAKEFTYKSHCSYEREEHWTYPESKKVIFDLHDKESIYQYLVKGWLVPISYKNVFYVDSDAKKDGNGYILTEKFQTHDTGFFGKSRADSIVCYENEMFFTYEACEKYIAYRQFCAEQRLAQSDEEYSLCEACQYLKRQGFSATDRKKYLDAFKKVDNIINKELWVRDGKVYVNSECDKAMLMNRPKCPDNFTRSKKAREEYNEKCAEVRRYNWTLTHKLLEV
mgnify:FL=1